MCPSNKKGRHGLGGRFLFFDFFHRFYRQRGWQESGVIVNRTGRKRGEETLAIPISTVIASLLRGANPILPAAHRKSTRSDSAPAGVDWAKNENLTVRDHTGRPVLNAEGVPL